MARLSRQEKNDLLILSKGAYFKKLPPKKLSFEEYLDFLTMANAFGNHKPRKFKAMSGKNFKF